jgi:hypothetical protein
MPRWWPRLPRNSASSRWRWSQSRSSSRGPSG